MVISHIILCHTHYTFVLGYMILSYLIYLSTCVTRERAGAAAFAYYTAWVLLLPFAAPEERRPPLHLCIFMYVCLCVYIHI